MEFWIRGATIGAMKRERFIHPALLASFCGSFFLTVASLTATAATEEKINKRFTVQPGGTVVVNVEFGAIEVTTNATSEVVVEVWRKIGRSSKSDEEKFLKDNPVNFAQDGDTVTVKSHGKSRNN